MNAHIKLPLRTECGYQLGNFAAQGLPPRQSQELLLLANGCTEAEAAQVMNCSVNNIKRIKQDLFFKTGTFNSAELIARAFASRYLRYLTLFIAMFLGCGGSTWLDHQNKYNRIARHRPSPKRARSRTGNSFRDGDIYWDPETNQLITSGGDQCSA